MIEIIIDPPVPELIARLTSDIQGAIRAGVFDLAEAVLERAQEETPVRTSNLVNSETIYFTDNGMVATIKATARYAQYVHDGTGIYHEPDPHEPWTIRPRIAKALYWAGLYGYQRDRYGSDESAPGMHPVKSAYHLGSHMNPFFRRAIELTDCAGVFEDGMQRYLDLKEGGA